MAPTMGDMPEMPELLHSCEMNVHTRALIKRGWLPSFVQTMLHLGMAPENLVAFFDEQGPRLRMCRRGGRVGGERAEGTVEIVADCDFVVPNKSQFGV